MNQPPGISPSSMVAPPLAEMACENAVETKLPEEVHRRWVMDDERECKVRLSYHETPSGLLVALRSLSNIKMRSRSLIERCLSHHGLALLSNLREVRDLNRQYHEILVAHAEHGGLSDIVDQANIRHYRSSSAKEGRGTFCSVERVVAEYVSYSDGLGVGVPALVAVCLAWSLSTSVDPCMSGVVREMRPEVAFFRRYVEERAIMMDAFWRIARGRLDHDEAISLHHDGVANENWVSP